MLSRPEPTEAVPLSPRSRWLAWLPVALLLLGVLAQAVLMQTVNATPQAGSGFTMFSTVDFGSSRRVIATAEHDGITIAIDIPDSLRATVAQLNREPTNAKAGDLAATLASLQWQVDDGSATEGGDVVLDVVVTVRGLQASGRTLESHVMASSAP